MTVNVLSGEGVLALAACLAGCTGKGKGLDQNGQPIGESRRTPQDNSEHQRQYFVELHGFV